MLLLTHEYHKDMAMKENNASNTLAWVFVGELANNTENAVSISVMGSVLNNINPIDQDHNITGFTGVYVVLNPSGSVAIKAQLTKREGADKSQTKTFNLNDYDLCDAYNLAVKERSQYLGLHIEIPKLKKLTYKKVYDYLNTKFGKEWAKKNKASSFLKKMNREKGGDCDK